MRTLTRWCWVGLCLYLNVTFSQMTMAEIAAADPVKTAYSNAISDVFENVDLSLVPSGILYQRGISYIDLTAFDGSSTEVKANMISFSLAYASITTMAVDSTKVLPSPSAYRNKMDIISPQSNRIIVAGLHQVFHKIDSNAIADNLFTRAGNNLADLLPREESPYVEQELFLFAPAEVVVHQPSFLLSFDEDLFFNNSGKMVDSLLVDADNGGGFTPLNFGEDLQVVNLLGGAVQIKVKLVYTDGSIYYSAFDITTAASSYEATEIPDIIHTISPTYGMAPDDGRGGGEVNVHLACGHEKIEKPFIWAEAYNPVVGSVVANLSPEDIEKRLEHIETVQDGTDITLWHYLRQNGYDIIILDYADGADYLPRTAEFIKEALHWVNNRKEAAGSNAGNVILGQSMGGVATALALKDMEADTDLDHEVDQFIIFDSPIMGVNIPLTAQACLLDMSFMWVDHPFPWGDDKFLFQYVEFLEDVIDILYLPATRTMVSLQCDDITLSDTEITLPFILETFFDKEVNSLYADFYNNLHNDLGGLPAQCDVLTIANGSKRGVDGQQPYAPGDLVVEAGINNFVVASLIGFWLSDVIMGADLTLFEAEEVFGNYGLLLWQAGLEVNTSTKLYAMKNETDFEYYSNLIEVNHWWFDFPMIFHSNNVTKTDGIEVDNAPGGFFGVENNGVILDEAELGPLMPTTFKMQTWCFTPTGSVLNYHGLEDETWQDELLRPYNNPEYDMENNLLRGVSNYVSNSETPNFGTVVSYNNTAHTWFTQESSRFMHYQLIGKDELDGITELSSGTTFNYGRSAMDEAVDFASDLPSRTSSILGHSLTVENTQLTVNALAPIGLAPSPYLPTVLGEAKPNSHFVMHLGSICDHEPVVVLKIDDGGELIIGDGYSRTGSVLVQEGHFLDVKNGGTVIIKSGSTLKLNPGGKLLLRNGGRIIIEDGANLITESGSVFYYHYGGELELNGHESLLRLGGTLHLHENAHFKPIHEGVSSGTVVIAGADGVLEGESGSSFEIVGDTDMDPMLVIAEEARLEANGAMELMRISSCKVLLRSFEGNQIRSFAPYHSYNVNYEVQSNLEIEEYRPYISFHNRTHISNCSFTDISFYAEQLTLMDGIFLRCLNTSFTSTYKKEYAQCKITGGNLFMQMCDFTDFTGAALVLDGTTSSSRIEMTAFESDNIESASAIADISAAETFIRGCEFKWCKTGVAKRYGKASLKCNTFDQIGQNAIFGGSNARLNLSTNDNAGYNTFSNFNGYNIELSNAGYLHINQGNNSFDNVEGYPTLIGDIEFGGPYLTAILAHQNHWNAFGAAPADAEFDLVSSMTGDPIFVAAAVLGAGPCGSADADHPIVDLPGGGHTYLPSVSLSGIGHLVRLDSAVTFASMASLAFDPAGNNELAIQRYGDILKNPFTDEELDDPKVSFYLNLAYHGMKQTVYHAISDSSILKSHNLNTFSAPVQEYVDVLNKYSSSDTIASEDYVSRFYLELDKAHLLRSLGHASTGLDILKNLNLCSIDSAEQVVLNEWLLLYNEELTRMSLGENLSPLDTIYTDTTDYLMSIDIQLAEAYFGSRILGPGNVTYKDCSGGMAPEMPVNNLADFALKLYPNPTNGLVNLQYTLPDKAKGKILLFSIDGKQVGTFDLDKGTNPTVLDISYLPNGLYLYKMTINDKHEASGRVSVMN